MKQKNINYLFLNRDKLIMFGRSLICLAPNNIHRIRIHKIITNKIYIYFIDFCIICNAIIFGIFNMNEILENKKYNEYKTLYFIDIIFVRIFCIEIILNIIVFGFLSTPSSLAKNWNKLIDPIHKENWRKRCLFVWKLMMKYNKYYNIK